MQQLAIRVVGVGDLCVSIWLHTAEDPGRDEFAAALQMIADRRVAPRYHRSMVVSDGGAPNAVQRRQLAALHPNERLKMAVVTTVLANPIKRGIATALSWANPSIAFFVPQEFNRGLDHLDLGLERERVWSIYRELQRELPANQNLEIVARTFGLPAAAP